MLRSFARAALAWGFAAVFLSVQLALCAGDARANGWPPPRGASLRDPDNWPSDPAYDAAWNYWILASAAGCRSGALPAERRNARGQRIARRHRLDLHDRGGPDVLIAIADSGIEWDDLDLAGKAFLNAGELTGSHGPRDASGNACGGTGPLRGYDCDGDGVLTMKDYANDPRLTPIVSGDPCFLGGDPSHPGPNRVLGDVNHNCLLDAGDLIELFSDGVDDDANGYTDDISGWDFFANDNDPFDDTRSGHGTRGSRGIERPGQQRNRRRGGMPGMPLSHASRERPVPTAEANDFAKAVVYATDVGASVLQAGLVTVDQSAFSKAALDYAYSRGTLVVASVGEENSRHHDQPNVANHTLPVHAIVLDGAILADTTRHVTTSSSTFIAFNTCSNYGAQNMLSVSAASCSSEAAAAVAGAAGLLFSEARARALQLSAEEAMQLLKMTADDIDVAASRSTDPAVAGLYYESKPGFDQRFGYGRPNLDRAMQAVDAGLVPPEVDIVSPEWFDVLYADRIVLPVPILGHITAKRAPSYDYRVEWAAGTSSPSDAAFQPLVDWVRNVPGTTTTGNHGAALGLMRTGADRHEPRARPGFASARKRPDHHGTRRSHRALPGRGRAGGSAPGPSHRQYQEPPRSGPPSRFPDRARLLHRGKSEARGHRRRWAS